MQKKILLSGIAMLVVVAGAFYIYGDVQKTRIKNQESGMKEEASPSISLELEGAEGENLEGVQVEIVEDVTSPESLTYWINLGLEKRVAGDYEGARDAWEYASQIRPKNTLSFHNLGQLYAYFLKDSAKAELNFKTAISNDPKLSYIYVSFFEFYRDVLKDSQKAKAVLNQGLAVQNLDNPEVLRALLENFN